MPLFDRIMRIFLSRKFAVYLLLLMLAFLVLGSILPDIDTMTDAEIASLTTTSPVLYQVSTFLRVQRLISSPYFLVLPVLIFLSTTICTSRRFTVRRRKEGGFFYEAPGTSDLNIERIALLLSSGKWRITHNGNSITADKGGSGFWGSIAFHLGLLLVFVAVVVSALTQFNAELLLTEGFPVRLGKEAFVKIYKNKGLSSLPPSMVELTKFVPFYEQDIYKKDFAALLSIDGEGREVHVNRPVDIGDFQFALHRFGFAPSFRIKDKEGSEILNATINLVVLDGKEDFFVVPETPYEVYARFFPDAHIQGGTIGSRSNLPKNPVFLLSVRLKGREVGKGLLAFGKTSKIGDLQINFDGLNYWADMIVSRDYGLWIFATSFALIVLGLTIRFVLPDKQIAVTVADNNVHIKGWCKYYPTFFEEEVKRILEKIQGERYNNQP